jgi:hypothetical protein
LTVQLPQPKPTSCPAPDYLDGLDGRASIYLPCSGWQEGIASKQTVRTGK